MDCILYSVFLYILTSRLEREKCHCLLMTNVSSVTSKVSELLLFIFTISFQCNYTFMLRLHACMHACMHACIHTYIHTYTHTYTHTCIHTCIHTYIHAYMHTCIHAYMHAYTHTYIHTYMHTCIHILYIYCVSIHFRFS